MSDSVRIDLEPIGKRLDVSRGTPLRDLLFSYGVEFPCGGHGRCKRCRVRVLSGSLPVAEGDLANLTAAELAEGWRLACRSSVTGPVTLEVGQWEAAVLADDSAFEFTPRDGLGLAVDLGTTTIVVQLLDLRAGHVLGVRTSLNPQVAFGSDVMSRVQFASTGNGLLRLRDSIREGICRMAVDVLDSQPHGRRGVERVAIVGNTVMHHLFCGIDVEPLEHYPFEPVDDGLKTFRASELGWPLGGNPVVGFLPCLGGFVGSDILAGVLASRMHERDSLEALVDLGTNGEVVLGNREKMLCASTAAGPAFEGARISMGMRAATGAISEVDVVAGRTECRVLGNETPRGICGSGLVDAVAAGLDLGIIAPSGRLACGPAAWMLAPPVSLIQSDIREMQLAKGAIAAAIRILLAQWGAGFEDVSQVHLAGAFGNYINRTSARRIGLINFLEDKVRAAGNTALLGAKLALFRGPDEDPSFAALRGRIRHISLASDPRFHEVFAECMSFE